MKKEDLFHSKLFRFILPLLAAVLIIALFQNGFHFGEWLRLKIGH